MHITQVGLILFTERYDACVAFYRDTLQLPVTQVQDTLTAFAFGAGYLMVEQGGIASTAEKSRSQNPTVLRFNVADVRQASALLRQRGVAVEVLEFDWGVIGVFCDPDGHRCELKSAPATAPEQDGITA